MPTKSSLSGRVGISGAKKQRYSGIFFCQKQIYWRSSVLGFSFTSVFGLETNYTKYKAGMRPWLGPGRSWKEPWKTGWSTIKKNVFVPPHYFYVYYDYIADCTPRQCTGGERYDEDACECVCEPKQCQPYERFDEETCSCILRRTSNQGIANKNWF